MKIQLASEADSPILAQLNAWLIKDEGHRNAMSLLDLQARMKAWLNSDYQAALFIENGDIAGYALWRKDPEFIYIRQFFICESYRGQAIGKKAFTQLKDVYWSGQRLRLDVLIENLRGLNFWRSVGFGEYCLTMETNA